MPDDSRVQLGHIAGAHGIRGEVVIKSYTEHPDDIAAYGPLSDETNTRAFTLLRTRVVAKGVIARLEGVADRNAAEALKGTRLFIARDKLPAPEPDEVYHADLKGLSVVSDDGEIIGTVVGIQNFGAGDLLEYRLVGRDRTEFLPFMAAWIQDIDMSTGVVTVTLPVYSDVDPDQSED